MVTSFGFRQNEAKISEFHDSVANGTAARLDRIVNALDNASELDDLRSNAQQSRPFGSEDWVAVVTKQLGLESTMKSRGRPKCASKASVKKVYKKLLTITAIYSECQTSSHMCRYQDAFRKFR